MGLFRVFEFFLVVVILPILLPVWLYSYALARLDGRRWLLPARVVGHHGRSLRLWETCQQTSLVLNLAIVRYSPRLLAVLKGDISLVGPALLSPKQASQLTSAQRARFAVVPGLVNSFFLQGSVKMCLEDEPLLALRDAANQKLLCRLGMLARAPVALILSGSGQDVKQLAMFGLKLENESMAQAVERVLRMASTNPMDQVSFVNPGSINIAMKHSEYRLALERSSVIFPDGIGIQLASRYLNQCMRANLNGTDLFPALCERLQLSAIGIYLLGAREAVVETMVERIHVRWPRVIISGFHHGYIRGKDEENRVLADIKSSGASILLVAMGVPDQELWIDRMRPCLTVNLVMGVGGLFDFVSGRIPRAPLWVRELGMEWCYRLILEPRRLWRRYLIGNFVFFWHLVRFHR